MAYKEGLPGGLRERSRKGKLVNAQLRKQRNPGVCTVEKNTPPPRGRKISTDVNWWKRIRKMGREKEKC
jgi:hypothetical protein